MCKFVSPNEADAPGPCSKGMLSGQALGGKHALHD